MHIEPRNKLHVIVILVLVTCVAVLSGVASASGGNAGAMKSQRFSAHPASFSLLRAAHGDRLSLPPDDDDDFWNTFDLRAAQQTPQQAPTQEKTADQTRKNIQVLTGLPDSQLEGVMDYMRASLGMNCLACHVRTGDKWEYEKDDKAEKKAARRMIQMVFDLNKSSKDIMAGGTNCYMCHRGQREPSLVATLPMPAPRVGGPGGAGGPGGGGGPAGAGGPGAAGGPAAAATPRPTPPPAAQFTEKYIQAIGGAAAIEKLKSRVSKGAQIAANGAEMPVEMLQAAPNLFLSSVTTPQGQTIMLGFDGTSGWQKTPAGQAELGGAKLGDLKRLADFTRNFRLLELFPALRFGGRTRINDRDTVVLVSRGEGGQTDRFYFDAETGLLVRALTVTPGVLGPVPSQVDYSDYREVDGVKAPFTIQQSYFDAAASWTRKFTEIKHNAEIDKTRFSPPKN